jgi:hypothetical protein
MISREDKRKALKMYGSMLSKGWVFVGEDPYYKV